MKQASRRGVEQRKATRHDIRLHTELQAAPSSQPFLLLSILLPNTNMEGNTVIAKIRKKRRTC
jgi:hypothetical protein